MLQPCTRRLWLVEAPSDAARVELATSASNRALPHELRIFGCSSRVRCDLPREPRPRA